jgi:8-oxo-dGTP pyrophosphatase MutT (NUDIX family)
MGMSEYIKNVRKKVGHSLLQMPSVTIISFDKSGRVLLVKHRDTNLWVTPGGAIEPCETPSDAAVREMWEETGLIVELDEILGIYGGPEFVVEYSNGDKTSYVMIVFKSRIIGGKLSPMDDESTDAAFFPITEILNLDTQPWVEVVISDIINNNKKAYFKPPIWKP